MQITSSSVQTLALASPFSSLAASAPTTQVEESGFQKTLPVQTEFPFGASCADGTGCTPPVENSNPAGASSGADGQGVCAAEIIWPLFPSYTRPSGFWIRCCDAQPQSRVMLRGVSLPYGEALRQRTA